jgi:hypothetical protein
MPTAHSKSERAYHLASPDVLLTLPFSIITITSPPARGPVQSRSGMYGTRLVFQSERRIAASCTLAARDSSQCCQGHDESRNTSISRSLFKSDSIFPSAGISYIIPLLLCIASRGFARCGPQAPFQSRLRWLLLPSPGDLRSNGQLQSHPLYSDLPRARPGDQVLMQVLILTSKTTSCARTRQSEQ